MTLTATSPTPSFRWLRYTGAFVAGFATVAVLSMATDAVLLASNIYPFALAYRTAFTVIGGYVAAWLAPANKLRLSVILGIVGAIAATAGAVAMWHIGHTWYPVALAALALPSTTLGGWLFTRASR
jgi:hypothetical protein